MKITPPIVFCDGLNFFGGLQMKKGMIFIDGSNVFFDWGKANPGKQMDVEKYINVVKGKYPNVDFIRTYYFTSETDNNKGFLQQINKLPYCQVVTGRLQDKTIKIEAKHGLTCPDCNKTVTGQIVTQTDKGTDVNIAVEMLKHAYAHSYDLAVLISRDADFVGVAKIIKNLGCNIEIVLFEASKGNAQELSANVDNVMLIESADYSSCER